MHPGYEYQGPEDILSGVGTSALMRLMIQSHLHMQMDCFRYVFSTDCLIRLDCQFLSLWFFFLEYQQQLHHEDDDDNVCL